MQSTTATRVQRKITSKESQLHNQSEWFPPHDDTNSRAVTNLKALDKDSASGNLSVSSEKCSERSSSSPLEKAGGGHTSKHLALKQKFSQTCRTSLFIALCKSFLSLATLLQFCDYYYGLSINDDSLTPS